MKMTWILGPCSIESREMYFNVGAQLSAIMQERDWYYKASFDKANRTSLSGGRGPGIRNGIEIFGEFKRAFPNVKLLTDVHECWQVEALASHIDCIQIPAFLCRQTDLLVECAKHFKKINIKKGQWMDPVNMMKGADKVKATNPDVDLWLCERGSQFGFDRLLVDFRTVELFATVFDKVILDCTHSTQSISESGKTTGDRKLAERYLLAASIFKYQGVFAETHPCPATALSDADCQIDLARMPGLMKSAEKIADLATMKNREK